jgi:multiple antibiotic resistance protein
MPTYDTLLNAFVTLFVTVDPIGNAPLFLGLTVGMAATHRRAVALRGIAIAFFIMSTFALTGTIILDGMGITINAFRVAGGLLLFYTAFEMIYSKRQERKEEVSQSALKEHIANIAVFPLAIPLISGPGSISAVILLSSQMGHGSGTEAWYGRLALIGVIFVMMLLALISLLAAERLDKYLGTTGRMVLTRLLGVLLAALSVQYVADGARALFAV